MKTGSSLQEYIADRNGVLYGYKGLTWKEISPKNNLLIDDLDGSYGVAVLPDPGNGDGTSTIHWIKTCRIFIAKRLEA